MVSGYKFHFRIYLFITAIQPDLIAYVYNDSHLMFTTVPYSTSNNYLGELFQPTRHLSNYDINARPENMKNYMSEKGKVGKGCCWDMNNFKKWLLEDRPDLSFENMWTQIKIISYHVAKAIASHRSIKQFKHVPFRHNELFGLDIMVDDDGKVWLLEYNNSPGLEKTDSHMPDGTKHPDLDGDVTTKNICHDRFAVLGIDRVHCKLGDASNFIRII